MAFADQLVGSTTIANFVLSETNAIFIVHNISTPESTPGRPRVCDSCNWYSLPNTKHPLIYTQTYPRHTHTHTHTHRHTTHTTHTHTHTHAHTHSSRVLMRQDDTHSFRLKVFEEGRSSFTHTEPVELKTG